MVVRFGDLTMFEQAVNDPSLGRVAASGLRMALLSEKAREEGEVAAVQARMDIRREHMQFLANCLENLVFGPDVGVASGSNSAGAGIGLEQEGEPEAGIEQEREDFAME